MSAAEPLDIESLARIYASGGSTPVVVIERLLDRIDALLFVTPFFYLLVTAS